MGDIDEDEPQETWESARGSLLGFAERYRHLGYGTLADKLSEGGPPRRSPLVAPAILDADFDGDPGAAKAVACAAANLRELALVIVPSGTPSHVVSFARHVLDVYGRDDVRIIAGTDLDAIASVCTGQPVARWLGLGPFTNLSLALRAIPDLTGHLAITQLVGSRGCEERNLRADVGAASHVVQTAEELLLVLDNEFGPMTALAAAQQKPFIDFSRRVVEITPSGNLRNEPGGHPVWVTTHIDSFAFGRWMRGQLVRLGFTNYPAREGSRWEQA
ncbi:nucleoside hydrolase [Nocardia terpenica]|uniref:Uncharacterized protein n=1 Tax=Nocardia terpenica TaxID=455432 RepID=A0A291RJX9_9NOCA|nr:hypothetical protein [Nocardia terpenica]ATL67402.1 hypothetical protein CRH09_15550 [Nocardia terpenica]